MAAPVNLLPHDGKVLLYSSFFAGKESDELLQCLLKKTDWRQSPVKLFGKEVLQPRLTASFADEGVEYGYSGVKLKSHTWTKEMLYIKQRAEEVAAQEFNSALLNLYRSGKDYMGWHRDNEKNLGPAPVIASVSFGAERRFQFRNYNDKKEVVPIMLGHGDLLLMLAGTQSSWEHRLPKVAGLDRPRVNLTFRNVVTRR